MKNYDRNQLLIPEGEKQAYLEQDIFQTTEPFPDFIFFQPCLFISLWTIDFGEVTFDMRI